MNERARTLYQCFIDSTLTKLMDVLNEEGRYEEEQEVHEINGRLRQICLQPRRKAQ